MNDFKTQGDKIAAINSHPTAFRTLDLMADAAVMCLAPPVRGVATGKTIGECAALFTMSDHGWVNGEEDLPLTIADLIHGLAVIHSHYAAAVLTYEPADVEAQLTGQTSVDVEKGRARRHSRAKTLREIAEHLSALTGAGAPSENWGLSRKRCHAVWSRVAEKFPGDDGRAMAIRDTWGREASFLAD